MTENPIAGVSWSQSSYLRPLRHRPGSRRQPTPYIDAFLKQKKASVSADEFWGQWRYRQRLEQFQDTIMALGHSG